MKKGQKLTYIGKGFLGFDKNEPYMEFVEAENNNEYVCLYQDYNVVVRKWEVEEMKQ